MSDYIIIMSSYDITTLLGIFFFFASCFRLNDLEVGEVIGCGFYGSVTKVSMIQCGHVMLGSHVIDNV